MIKVSELRIGNWVFHTNAFCRPYMQLDFDLIKNELSGNSYPELQPIPLTPEILEKCGWVWNEECNSFEKYPNGDARMNLQKKFNGGYTMFNYVIKALICENIRHLHQLQNLYFALTGTELEINL